MTLADAITWIFDHPDLALYGAGGSALFLLVLSVWGIIRAFRKRQLKRERENAASDTSAVAATVEAAAEEARFEEARLEEKRLAEDARLEEARVEEARLEKTRLAEARFEEVRLEEARLEEARLEEARLEEARLEKARLEEAVRENAQPATVAAPHREPAYAGPAAAGVQTLERPPAGESADRSATEPGAPATTQTAPASGAAPAPEPAPSAGAADDPAAARAAEVRALTLAVFQENFPRLQGKADEEAHANVAAFADELGAAATRLAPEEYERLSHADVQILLHSVLAEIAKRRDDEKNGVLVNLLIGRIRHHQAPEIVELLEQAIDVVRHVSAAQIKIVIMCLYLRSLQLRTRRLEELETIVKYATGFGAGANFSNMRTGTLFSRGLLMYNATMERIEGQMLKNFGDLFELDAAALEPHPGDDPERRRFVHERLNLSSDQALVLESWGQSQCGRATATGLGWAAAAAYIEQQTGRPADWERMVR